ncbi:MAG: hypothetical protein RLP44_06335 [Aggregatilineales bacterium]
MNRFAVFLLVPILAACGVVSQNQSISTSGESSTNEITVFSSQRSADPVAFTVDDVAVQLTPPTEWAVNTTPYGVLLTEHIRSIATEGQLDGILLHTFVDPLDDVRVSISDTTSESYNPALQILSQIVADTAYVGDSAVTSPLPFEWNGNPAAYYLLTNQDENVSLVLGVIAPETTRLLTLTVSAPVNQASRIRTLLPELLSSLSLNGNLLDASALNGLPDPLEFPVP